MIYQHRHDPGDCQYRSPRARSRHRGNYTPPTSIALQCASQKARVDGAVAGRTVVVLLIGDLPQAQSEKKNSGPAHPLVDNFRWLCGVTRACLFRGGLVSLVCAVELTRLRLALFPKGSPRGGIPFFLGRARKIIRARERRQLKMHSSPREEDHRDNSSSGEEASSIELAVSTHDEAAADLIATISKPRR